ncbi:MAG: OB-fold nucleic acid binding domain-containing protein, partial [Pseudolysinimonas sp.]
MTDDTAPSPEATEEDIAEQKAVRMAKRERLIRDADSAGEGAYPVTLPVTHSIAEVRATFPSLSADDVTGVVVGVAGRVVFLRNSGKLGFVALQAGDGGRLQAMFSLAELGEESLQRWKELVDLGDHLFVSGEVISSRRGELSILVKEWAIASKALLPLPNLYNELSDETRMRQRYLDLIVREQARVTVRA